MHSVATIPIHRHNFHRAQAGTQRVRFGVYYGKYAGSALCVVDGMGLLARVVVNDGWWR
ncbi:MAG: hypothetical protein AAF639_35420 [Chloroflexota bacterium]